TLGVMSPGVGRTNGSAGLCNSMVRLQLERILTSRTFLRSERMSAFLKFIVERTLDGHASSLKEQVLLEELYRRGSDCNGIADPVVRVDARRLRDKLREYYSEFADDPVIISLPKGSYIPSFATNPALPSVPEVRAGDQSPRGAEPIIPKWI